MLYYTMGSRYEYMAHRTVTADSKEEAIEEAQKLWTKEGRDIRDFHFDAVPIEKLKNSYGWSPSLLNKPPYWSGDYPTFY